MNQNERQKILDGLLFNHSVFSNVQLREKLVSLGADVNARNGGNESVIEHYADRNFSDYNVRKKIHPYFTFLLDHGAKINDRLLFPLAYEGELPTIELLVSKGLNLHTVNNRGNNLLHVARNNDHYSLIDYLLEQGLDVNALNIEGDTPFTRNRGLQNIDMLKKLESHGFDIHKTYDYDGYGSILHYVIQEPKCLKYLLEEKGLDPTVKNQQSGETVIEEIFSNSTYYEEDFLLSLLDKLTLEN